MKSAIILAHNLAKIQRFPRVGEAIGGFLLY
jgi:hypothetical protein